MTRTLFVGDLHAKPGLLSVVTRTADRYRVDRIVLLGDLMDDWNMSAKDLSDWATVFFRWVWGECGRRQLTVLVGNHDVPYLLARDTKEYARILEYGVPGFRAEAYRAAHGMLTSLPSGMIQPAWSDGRVVASHAGFTNTWLRRKGLSEAYVTPGSCALMVGTLSHAYLNAGPARGGRGTPSPLWADREELEADHPAGVIQIVGHTPVPTVTRSPDGLIWFCDTMSTLSDGTPIGDHTMLLYDDQKDEQSMFLPVPAEETVDDTVQPR